MGGEVNTPAKPGLVRTVQFDADALRSLNSIFDAALRHGGLSQWENVARVQQALAMSERQAREQEV